MNATPNLLLKIKLGGECAVIVQAASRIKIERGCLLVYESSGAVPRRISLNALLGFSVQVIHGCLPSLIHAREPSSGARK